MTAAEKIRERLRMAKKAPHQIENYDPEEEERRSVTNRFRMFTGCTVPFMLSQPDEWLISQWAQFVISNEEEVQL